MNSIRRHLLWSQTGAMLLATFIVGLITHVIAWEGVNRLRDFSLEQIAYTVLRHGVDKAPATTETQDKEQYVTQIWEKNGTIQYSSRPSLTLPLQEEGQHSVEWDGELWHIFTLVRSDVTVQVANAASNRSFLFERISHWLMVPLAALLLILGTMFWIAVGEVLQPFATLRRELSERDISRLHVLSPEAYPVEITPMVETLNQLMTSLDRTLTAQSRFIADAAHELRTPLTAIKLQTQIALASPTVHDRDEALHGLHISVNRAVHLVEQLLQLARLDPDNRSQTTPTEVVLDVLAKQLVSELSPLAEAAGVDLGVGECAAITVTGDADGLYALLRNLIDNALRYGKAQGRIDVIIRRASNTAIIEVIDDGPGIPDAEKDAVFNRFHRLASADFPGSGLGLAIVKEVVERHHGQITLLDAKPTGLCVRVELPISPETVRS